MYQFGRQFVEASNTSILLEHPSISRLHAILAYDGTQNCWMLKDMGSTHGTYVNQNKLD